jgi:Galactose oxidase, central domain
MFSNPWKKFFPYKSAPATSPPPQQVLPRQLPSTPGSQSHSPLQQQAQPDNPLAWLVLRPKFCSKGAPHCAPRSPFPRRGHTLFTTATGELLFFGGYARSSLRSDLYLFSTRDCSLTFLKTSGEVPSPRFMSAGVLVNNVLLIWGGATKLDDNSYAAGPYDDSLYLLSLGTSFDVKTDSS